MTSALITNEAMKVLYLGFALGIAMMFAAAILLGFVAWMRSMIG